MGVSVPVHEAQCLTYVRKNDDLGYVAGLAGLAELAELAEMVGLGGT